MGTDDTRPVSADSYLGGTAAGGAFTSIASGNFAVFEHYPPPGLGMYTEQVTPSTTRPFGVGEFV